MGFKALFAFLVGILYKRVVWFVLIKKKEKHLNQKEKYMSNYLKKMLFTLLILGVPFMNSVSKAMDVEDHEGSSVRARQVSFVTEDKQDVQSFIRHSTSPLVVNSEDSKVSWTSYLSSPVKSVFQGAYEIVDFAVQNPKIATLIGLSYMISAAEACNCQCNAGGAFGTTINVGQTPDVTTCVNVCQQSWWKFVGCL